MLEIVHRDNRGKTQFSVTFDPNGLPLLQTPNGRHHRPQAIRDHHLQPALEVYRAQVFTIPPATTIGRTTSRLELHAQYLLACVVDFLMISAEFPNATPSQIKPKFQLAAKSAAHQLALQLTKSNGNRRLL